MTANTLEAQINHEVTWRVDEISIVKTIPFLYNFSEQQRTTLKKHTIPIFYSLWEGFVVDSLAIYAREINQLKLRKNQICVSLLTHSVDGKLKLRSVRNEFDRQIVFVQEMNTLLDGEIEIPVDVPTESNVNYRVMNGLLSRFNLSLLPEVPYKKQLDKLLLFRNKLSHGEYTLPINQLVLDEMSNIVISCIHEVAHKIVDGYRKTSFLRS